MATRNYRLTQPTQTENHFDGIPSSMNQTSEIYIELRAQRDPNDQTSSNDKKEQPSMITPSKQQSKRNLVRELNTPRPVARPVNTYSIIEQPSPAKQQKKHICTCACCDCDKKSCRSCCCLPSSKTYHGSSHQNQHSSSTHSSSFYCFGCCFDDQSNCCDSNGYSNSCLKCGCCNCGGCDCDCGDCDCDLGD